jgi:transcriptional regulator with XRE-family HTH domain
MDDIITISDWSKLGAALRDERHARGFTQAEVAERAGVARSWLARVEAGHRGAELEPLLRLLAALDLSFTLAPRDAPVAPRGQHDAPSRRAAWGMATSRSSPPRPEGR